MPLPLIVTRQPYIPPKYHLTTHTHMPLPLLTVAMKPYTFPLVSPYAPPTSYSPLAMTTNEPNLPQGLGPQGSLQILRCFQIQLKIGIL